MRGTVASSGGNAGTAADVGLEREDVAAGAAVGKQRGRPANLADRRLYLHRPELAAHPDAVEADFGGLLRRDGQEMPDPLLGIAKPDQGGDGNHLVARSKFYMAIRPPALAGAKCSGRFVYLSDVSRINKSAVQPLNKVAFYFNHPVPFPFE